MKFFSEKCKECVNVSITGNNPCNIRLYCEEHRKSIPQDEMIECDKFKERLRR